MVCNVAFIIDASGVKPSTSHGPSSSSYQDHLKAILRTSIVDVPLDQRQTPVVGDLLGVKVTAKIKVPHVAIVYRRATAYKHLVGVLLPGSTSLGVCGKIEIKSVVKSLPKELANLFLDFICLLLLFIIIKLKRDDLDLVELVNDGGLYVNRSGEALFNTTDLSS